MLSLSFRRIPHAQRTNCGRPRFEPESFCGIVGDPADNCLLLPAVLSLWPSYGRFVRQLTGGGGQADREESCTKEAGRGDGCRGQGGQAKGDLRFS